VVGGRNRRLLDVFGAATGGSTMRKLLLAGALLVGVSLARPAAAQAGFFFSFSQPGFGIAVGEPFYAPRYYYPPPPVVYVPPPVFYGGYYPRHPRYCGRGYAWGGYGYRSRGHRWR
jgi:hypothetical protein